MLAFVSTAAGYKTNVWVRDLRTGRQRNLTAAKTIAGAYLDTVTPEPLPADDPLWSAPNTIHSMHLSGRSQTKMFQRAAALFLRNLDAFLAGQTMENVVDLDAGY